MKVAIVYDRVNKWGGAERILLALRSIFPDAPLFTSVYNKKKASWAEVFNIKTSFLQSFPLASSHHELYASLMPIAFESFNFEEYDLVISVTSEAAKGIITKPKTLHICYCLTPTRYLWSSHNDYFVNPVFKFLSKPFVSYLRKWDKIASNRPDHYIAISKEVQKRIKEYYGINSELIYPSVGLKPDSLPDNFSKGNYFLVVSRLVPYKRIDIAIKACNRLKLPLKVVGKGIEEKRLKKISGPTIEFLSDLTDKELSNYYKNAKALIFPGNEDFGLAMLESQLHGRPVLAFRGGGAKELIIEGKTGEFFDEQSSKALISLLENFDEKRYNSSCCVRNAEKFSSEKFKSEFVSFIKSL